MQIKGLIVFGAVLLLFGCGGGSGGGASPSASTPTNAGGIWEGVAVTSGVSLEFTGILTEDGEGRFIDENGTQYIISSLSGNNGAVRLNFTAVAQFGFTFQNGSTLTTGVLTGTIDERSSFEGSYSVATGESGTIELTYNPIYERASTLDKLTGNWDEAFGIATFDPDGSFFEQDMFGCVFDGNASVIDPQYNAYRLTMTVSLCDTPANGQYSGVGVLADFNTANDMLIIQLNSDEIIFTTTLFRL